MVGTCVRVRVRVRLRSRARACACVRVHVHADLDAATLFDAERCASEGGRQACLDAPMMRLPVKYTMNALWYFEKVSAGCGRSRR